MLASTFVDDFLSRFGYAAVFAFVGIESMGIPFPGETMLISAALYAGATHHLNIAVVVVTAASGAIVGDNIGFGLGNWGGYRLLLRYGRYMRLHPARVKLARYLFLRHGGKVVFFGRFISVLRTYAAFLAGTARMPWLRFLIFNALGGIIWASVYGEGAYLAGDRITKLSRPVDFGLAAVAIVVVVALIFILRRKEEVLSAKAEVALPGPLEAS
jgi:membrane protein DedA with SNARE-associated domain